MTATPHDPLARLRWGVYLVLMAVAVGNMTGRLLAVNSVDKAQLEATRIQQRLDAERARFKEQGLSGAKLDERMAVTEARLRDAEQNRQRSGRALLSLLSEPTRLLQMRDRLRALGPADGARQAGVSLLDWSRASH